MQVRKKQSENDSVSKPASNLGKVSTLLRTPVGEVLQKWQSTRNQELHTGNWLPSIWSRGINNSDVEVVNLHWVGGETMSIEDIGRIRKPVVMSLHDMWPFCGTEHYADDGPDARWRTAYSRNNRPSGDSGPDLDMRAWKRKRRAWTSPMHLVAPSEWVAKCARNSALLGNRPVSVIPYPLDTQVYRPLEKKFCRHALNLPQDARIVLFGAIGGTRNLRKGYDLLARSLDTLATRSIADKVLLVIFGQCEPQGFPELRFPCRWFDHLYDDLTLAMLYSAADVMVVPSRKETFGQTSTEAQACGCPVVAFDCTGLRETLTHKVTGYLAKPFDTGDMAAGIAWVLDQSLEHNSLGQAARKRAEALWSYGVVVPQILEVYERAIEEFGFTEQAEKR